MDLVVGLDYLPGGIAVTGHGPLLETGITWVNLSSSESCGFQNELKQHTARLSEWHDVWTQLWRGSNRADSISWSHYSPAPGHSTASCEHSRLSHQCRINLPQNTAQINQLKALSGRGGASALWSLAKVLNWSSFSMLWPHSCRAINIVAMQQWGRHERGI